MWPHHFTSSLPPTKSQFLWITQGESFFCITYDSHSKVTWPWAKSLLSFLPYSETIPRLMISFSGNDLQILRGLTANLQQIIFLTVLYLESGQLPLKWNLELDKDYTTHFPVCFRLGLFYLPGMSLWWIFRDDIVKSLGVPVILYKNLQGH